MSMRIRQPIEGRTNPSVLNEKHVNRNGMEGKERYFLDTLKKLSSDQVREKLDQLLKRIDEQGKVLQNTLSLRDLMGYKGLVKEFMGIVVSQTYDLKEELGWNQRGQSKVYSLLKKVDESLEELTKGFLDQESEQIDLLGKLGEIRGMLVDLYT